MEEFDIILNLYRSIIYEEINKFGVNENDIRLGIQEMKDVYKPNPLNLQSNVLDVVAYSKPSHRIAYLHKFAALHTLLVEDMFQKAVESNADFFQNFIRNYQCFNICSLGGGPGTDVIGAVSVLKKYFGVFNTFATIIDFIPEWQYTFNNIVEELRYSNYGSLCDAFNSRKFSWKYIKANLLEEDMLYNVSAAIGSSHFITMIKFVSAANSKDTVNMIKNIFNAMQPGAIVLYIDNSGGGFHQAMKYQADMCNMHTVFGPCKHVLFSNRAIGIKRFGYISAFETRVSMHLWMKPHTNNLFINFVFNTQPTSSSTQRGELHQNRSRESSTQRSELHQNRSRESSTQRRRSNQNRSRESSRGRERLNQNQQNRSQSNRVSRQRNDINDTEDEEDNAYSNDCCIIL